MKGASFDLWQCRQYLRDEWLQIGKSVSLGTKDKNGDPELGKVLLEGQVSVDRKEYIKFFLRLCE